MQKLVKRIRKAKLIWKKARHVMGGYSLKFLLAYYHFEVLRFYGPCPITDSYIPQDTPNANYNGRSHYDYVTEWIVNMLEDAIRSGLPDTRTKDVSEWGRATTVIAKALKARVLMYAASPLWNGSFPYPEWQNKNFETPGYGKELVSKTYSREKWVRAQKACEEAVNRLDAELKERRGTAGDLSLIAMNNKGEWGVATNIEGFSFAVAVKGQAPVVYLVTRQEDGHCSFEEASEEWMDNYMKTRMAPVEE